MEEKDYIDHIIDVCAAKTEIDISKYNREEIRMGMAVEMEHGTKKVPGESEEDAKEKQKTNVTDDDPVKTFQIVLSHMEEMGDYYSKHKEMEKKKLDETRRFKELAGVIENDEKKQLVNEDFNERVSLIKESKSIKKPSLITETKKATEDFVVYEFDKEEEKKEEVNESEDKEISLDFINEKAVSKQQQKFMGIVRAVQKGDMSADEVSPAVEKAAKSMKPKEVLKFAKTKHKGLPKSVEKS